MTWIIMGLIVVFLALAALIGCRRMGDTKTFMGREYTQALKGLSCLIVVMVHFPAEYGNTVQDLIGSFAYICVTFFFLCSGYGMRYSLEHKKGYLQHFLRKRLSALLIPVVVFNVCAFLIGVVWQGGVNASTLDWLLSISDWIKVLLMYCICFYLVYRFVFKEEKNRFLGDMAVCAFVLITSLITRLTEFKLTYLWTTECLGFAYGILLYRYKDRLVAFLNRKSALKTAVFFALSLVCGVTYLKMKNVFFLGDYVIKIILCLVMLMFLFSATLKIRIGNRVNQFLGKISYEVYLIHSAVIEVLLPMLPQWESGVMILIAYVVTIAASAAMNAVSKRLLALIPR